MRFDVEVDGGNRYVYLVGIDPETYQIVTEEELNQNLSLRDRVWTCAACGTTHDRDILAANNIVRFAFCKQDTSNKISASAKAAAKIPLERRKLEPVERPVRGAAKQEIAAL